MKRQRKQPIFRIKISVCEYGESPKTGHVYEITHKECTPAAIKSLNEAENRYLEIIRDYENTYKVPKEKRLIGVK